MLALIVFGTSNDFEQVGRVDFNCPNCGYTPTNLGWAHRKASVYFIPLFSIGKSYGLACDNCGLQVEIDDALGQQLHDSLSNQHAPRPAVEAPPQPQYAAPPAQLAARPQQYPLPDQSTTALGQYPGAGTAGGTVQPELGEQTRRLTQPPGAAAGAPPAQAAAPSGTCRQCGAMLPEGAHFCQNCGAAAPGPAQIAQQRCANCGHTQSAGRFCNNCGARLPNTMMV